MSATNASSSETAGPSRVNFVSPPEFAKPDDAFPTEQVLVRLSPKRSFLGFRKARRRSKASLMEGHGAAAVRAVRPPEPSQDTDPLEMPFVQLGNTVLYSAELEEDYTRDVYRWAVLYENQRGYVQSRQSCHRFRNTSTGSPCSQRPTIHKCHCCLSTHRRSRYPQGPTQPITSRLCRFHTTPFRTAIGSGSLARGWSTCAETARRSTTASSTTGSSEASTGILK